MTTKPTARAALTWRAVTARRMARHALAEPATGLGPAGIAGVLCGAHAQVLTAAELSIGRRIAGATRSDVQRALWQERTLVKTFGPRGTIHLLATADLPMWTGALQALPSSVPTHPDGVRFTPERLYPGAAAIRALTPAGQAGNYPVLLVDGVVGGVWHQRRSGRKLAITVEPLHELTASQYRQLGDEVDLVGAVMEAPATLTVGTVTVGAHA
jgi:DNA glycosylase AlkZ-like